jgi:hypothetical protein
MATWREVQVARPRKDEHRQRALIGTSIGSVPVWGGETPLGCSRSPVRQAARGRARLAAVEQRHGVDDERRAVRGRCGCGGEKEIR